MRYAVRVQLGERVDLGAIGTRAPGLAKEDGKLRLKPLVEEIGELQELLYAAGTHAVLVVLQGLDTSGKDGTIRHVFAEADPQGVRVAPFKVPTEEELAHDFLWRIHREAPRRGMLTVFNRSHYEDVLIVRVKELVPEPVWRARYEHINAFERLLTSNQTVLLKFYLHISEEEQKERLLAREQDVEKAWKLSADDWVERRAWDDYIAAYEEALTSCTTTDAPWWIVPADQKWFRNLAVAEAIVEQLRPLREGWLERLADRGREELAAIERARRGRKGQRD